MRCAITLRVCNAKSALMPSKFFPVNVSIKGYPPLIHPVPFLITNGIKIRYSYIFWLTMIFFYCSPFRAYCFLMNPNQGGVLAAWLLSVFAIVSISVAGFDLFPEIKLIFRMLCQWRCLYGGKAGIGKAVKFWKRGWRRIRESKRRLAAFQDRLIFPYQWEEKEDYAYRWPDGTPKDKNICKSQQQILSEIHVMLTDLKAILKP